MRRIRLLICCCSLLPLGWAVLSIAAETVPPAEESPNLSPAHARWLLQVHLLITEEEREYFLSLTEDFRRDAFIERFWQVRDPESRTAANEAKRRWMSRVDQVLADYSSPEDDRARVLLLNGQPEYFVLPSGREIQRCWHKEREIEIWFYAGSERARENFQVIFYKPDFARSRPYRIWVPEEKLRASRRLKLAVTNPLDFCSDLLPAVMAWIRDDPFYYHDLLQRILAPPAPNSSEWVSTFAAKTTDLPPDAETFPLELAFDFPGRNQNRTAVQGVVNVARAGISSLSIDGQPTHQLLLNGEVVRDGKLFESFRYRFELPSDEETENLPLVFQRYLRAGDVEIRVRLEDLLGRRFAVASRRLTVPAPGDLASVRVPGSELFGLLGEANAAAERGQQTIRILPPPEGEIQVGRVRFTTVTNGDFDKVTFYLNEGELMTDRRPPFSVELNLGASAASHRLRVVAFDGEGGEVASDEIPVNQGGQRFRVRITEPRSDRAYRDSIGAVVQVEVPDGQVLERLEIFMSEQRIATLYQEPFVQPILLDGDELTYLRAVGYLEDGNSTEDVVFINAPEYFEQVEVQYVELYASVYGRSGRPLLDLEQGDFQVFEDGALQEIRRFTYVRDLPIHAALLIDVSASMKPSLASVAAAAETFVQETIQEKDRVALVSFNQQPYVEVKFSNDLSRVTKALTAMRAGGSTALYDSLVYSLHYFDGMKGQKALLLLSDGEDEASRFTFDSALEVAQRAGVTVYVIGLKEVARNREAKKVLRQFATETGGRAFFVEDLEELPAIYQTIQEELRSQYLLAYQSTSSKNEAEFRAVKVEVEDKGAEVRTLAGYYP